MTAFDALRHEDEPVTPDPRFADELRMRLMAALTPDIDLPERTPVMTDTTGDRAPSAAAPTSNGLAPYISVHDAAGAIDWYRIVFGATEIVRYVGDDGRIGHCEIELGGGLLMLADEYPDFGAVGPRTVGGTPVKLHLEVPEVDAVWDRAIANGADGERPPETQPYGRRSCSFGDPFGHRWIVQTVTSEPTDAEIEAGFGGGFDVVRPSPTESPRDESMHPVEIGYLTLGFDDTDRARVFYGELFGWVTEDGNAGSGYAHVANTTLPMGLTPDGVDTRPTMYFRVDDAEELAARVVELGGRVVARAGHESGGSIECVDDQGRAFTLWQPAPGY